MASSAWKTIKSAPKDGTKVLSCQITSGNHPQVRVHCD
jgi:hypothetical protein